LKVLTTIHFWLLDINHKVVDDNVEIRLWGKDGSGATAVLVNPNYPHFYLLPKVEKETDKVLKEAEAVQSKNKGVVQVELVEKNYFGRPVRAVEVRCDTPEAVVRYSKLFSKMPSVKECLEDDIRPAARYTIENGVNPSGWYEVEVSELSRPYLRVEHVYETVGKPRHVERLQTPDFKILAMSIVCFSEKGSPDPKKDPVLAITMAADPGGTEQFVSDGKGDSQVLERFISRLQELDPDIVVGYGQNTFDWPYLIERCRRQKLKLSVDRSGGEPHRSVYGHISVTGRANIDLANVSEDIPEVKVKTLGSVAEFLQVAGKAEVDRLQDVETGDLWRSPEKREKLLEYSRKRSEVSLEVARLLLDFEIQLSNVTGLPLDQVAAAAVGFRVDSHLMTQAYRLNELIPRRAEQPYFPYQGAIVMEPKPGIHDNVAVLDFTSMYPNLMIMYNLSPDSYVGDLDLPKGEVVTVPEVGFTFRKEPPGFYRRVLENLISIRGEIKKRLGEVAPKSVEYRVLRERDKAIKVIANACYGYAGWVGARWYVREVAESAAAFGRAALRKVLKMAESLSLPVIYGDTDAVFVEYDQAKVKRLLERVEAEMGMEIKVDKVYGRVLFTEAKKKYAGLLPDGTLDIVGLEVVRGDWSNVAKTVQEKVLEFILKGKDVQEPVEYLRGYIQDLRLGKVPLSELAIWKTLTKPVEAYRVKSPHVEAAKTLLRAGWSLRVGDKVGFIITKGSGRLYQRVKPYIMASPDEVDFEYYVRNQVLPAAMRILEMFGVDEGVVLSGSEPRGLSGFLGRA